jgi:hypothetical protein
VVDAQQSLAGLGRFQQQVVRCGMCRDWHDTAA